MPFKQTFPSKKKKKEKHINDLSKASHPERQIKRKQKTTNI
jgi:hypothetical protein